MFWGGESCKEAEAQRPCLVCDPVLWIHMAFMSVTNSMIFILCVFCQHVRMYVHHIHALCPQRPESDAVSPEAAVADDCEL